MTTLTPKEEEPDALDWHDVQPTVERVTRSVWYKFRDYTEPDDVRQATWLAYFENRTSFDELFKDETTRKLVHARLRRAAVEYCLIEKANRCGYEPDDQYWYSRGELRAILPMILTGKDEDQGITSETGKVRRTGARQYMELETALVDVRQAMLTLPTKDRQALMECWGGLNETVSPALRYAAGRALGKLQRALGERPPARGKFPDT